MRSIGCSFQALLDHSSYRVDAGLALEADQVVGGELLDGPVASEAADARRLLTAERDVRVFV
jgi:hypothetical protein